MSKNKLECSKCKGQMYPYVYKGYKGEELCELCAQNVCSKCGKKENRTELREGEDCMGNKVIREEKVEMYSQFEKDKNNSDRQLLLLYCDEHKEEALKNPRKWTKDDTERIIRQREQKELEIEEKLNSQKGLFYIVDPFACAVEWKQIEGIEYGCIYFQGKENGRNYYLLVPDTHPDLANFRYKEKVNERGREAEYTHWTLKKETYYLIEGVGNLSLEATSAESYLHNVPDSFCKVVGSSDRIKILENDKEPKNQNEEGECDNCHKSLKPGQEGVYVGDYQGTKSDRLHVCYDCYQNKEQEYLQNYAFVYSYSPVRYQKNGSGYIKNDGMYCYDDKKGLDGEILGQKDCPHCQPWKKHKNRELDTNFLLQYFQKKNLKSIKLEEGEGIIIESNNGSLSLTNLSTLLNDCPELQGVNEYLQSRHGKKISRQELEGNNNSETTKNPQGNKSSLLWYGLGGVLLIIGGIISWLVLRKRKIVK